VPPLFRCFLPMDFSRFTTISFDCYGTLINWEAGILTCLRGVLADHGQTLPTATFSRSTVNLKQRQRAGRIKAIVMSCNR
jgi:FMN phosphatase YigB (HAD superfamily)